MTTLKFLVLLTTIYYGAAVHLCHGQARRFPGNHRPVHVNDGGRNHPGAAGGIFAAQPQGESGRLKLFIFKLKEGCREMSFTCTDDTIPGSIFY